MSGYMRPPSVGSSVCLTTSAPAFLRDGNARYALELEAVHGILLCQLVAALKHELGAR